MTRVFFWGVEGKNRFRRATRARWREVIEASGWNVDPNRLSLPDARTCLLDQHARRFIEAPSRVEVVYPSELFGPFV